MSYPAYAETKPSGVEWLGELPTDWQIKRLKFCAHVIDVKLDAVPANVRYIGMENIESNTGRLFFNEEQKPGEGACIVFQAGDVLFGKLRPYLAKATLAKSGGVCTTEILALRPYDVDSRFLLYYLLSDNVIKVIDASTYGVKMPRASWDFIGSLPQTLPPVLEQQQIAAFLDRKTAQLDAVLAQKERQLGLLAEKRQALISKAVTRGLDPTALLKPSGIPWLGDVPEHWEVMPIKYLSVKIGSGKTPRSGAESYVSSGVIFLRSQNVYDNGLRLDDVAFISDEVDEEMSNSRVQSGDLLLNITGASIGRTCIMPADIPGANVNQHVCIIRLKPRLAAKFVAYYLKSNLVKHQISSFENGSSREGLNFEQVGSLLITLPKISISEQQEIVIYLDRETARMDGIAQAIQVQREKVREYRQALISAAVTGKIDVREEANADGAWQETMQND